MPSQPKDCVPLRQVRSKTKAPEPTQVVCPDVPAGSDAVIATARATPAFCFRICRKRPGWMNLSELPGAGLSSARRPRPSSAVAAIEDSPCREDPKDDAASDNPVVKTGLALRGESTFGPVLAARMLPLLTIVPFPSFGMLRCAMTTCRSDALSRTDRPSNL